MSATETYEKVEKGEMPLVNGLGNADCTRCGKVIMAGSAIEFERFTGKRWHLGCADRPETTANPDCPPHSTDKTDEQVKGGGKGDGGPDPLAQAIKVTVPAIASDQAIPMPFKPEDFLAGMIRDTIRGMVEEGVKEAPPQEIEIPAPEPELSDKQKSKRMKGMFHKDLPMLIRLTRIRNHNGHRLNVYMHGPAGGGKSTAAKQAADMSELGWGYTSLNPQTPDSRILGYMHAGGEYVESEFFRKYTNGGVFCFDEIDNGSASLVTTLNSMLENGAGAFPHGVFNRHPDFVCVCTANTIGRGGDVHYPERRPLDGAFLERFVFLEWAHDAQLTRMIVERTLDNNKKKAKEFMAWVEAEGKKLTTRFPTSLVTPRAFIQGALLEKKGIGREMIYDMVIGRGVKLPKEKK